MHLTLISARRTGPQPHWSVWYPKPDLASWRSVENHFIWSPVSQWRSFGVIVWPCDLGCQWVYWPDFQHVCIISATVKIRGQLEFSVPSPLLPARCGQCLYLTKYRKLEICPLLLPPVELMGRQTLGLWKKDRSCAGCIAHPPHVFLNTDTYSTISKSYLIALKSIKCCSVPRENFTSCTGWNHKDSWANWKEGLNTQTHKNTSFSLVCHRLLCCNDSVFVPWKALQQCQHCLQPWACWQKRMFYK